MTLYGRQFLTKSTQLYRIFELTKVPPIAMFVKISKLRLAGARLTKLDRTLQERDAVIN